MASFENNSKMYMKENITYKMFIANIISVKSDTIMPIGKMDNSLFKQFRDLCEMYVCNKYIAAFI